MRARPRLLPPRWDCLRGWLLPAACDQWYFHTMIAGGQEGTAANVALYHKWIASFGEACEQEKRASHTAHQQGQPSIRV
jgi:hypothetical protein